MILFKSYDQVHVQVNEETLLLSWILTFEIDMSTDCSDCPMVALEQDAM
jgi:hypothetical protein